MFQQIRSAAASDRAKPQAAAVTLLDDQAKSLPAGYRDLDRQAGGALTAALKRAEFSRRAGAVTCLYPAKGPGRIYVLALGTAEKLTPQTLRLAGGNLVRTLVAAKVTSIRADLEPGLKGKIDAPTAARALGDGLAIGNFAFDEYRGAHKTKPKAGDKKKINLAVQIDKVLRKALDRGLTVGRAANIARTLAATPPNVANPKYVADYCRKMAREVGLKCTVIDAAKAKRLGMGGLTAVGQAGSTPPAMICLEWPGSASGKSAGKKQPTLLVGKAITFDTGGYSLKTGGSMLGMKYDKCGGMAVIGAMQAVAKLKLPQRVVGIIAAAENMVDTTAYRPNDIITMINGVTVEVTNTDAEGRFVLADALAYGCKTYKPKAVLDLATLTGGVVVALGSHCAGVFVNDEKLRKTVMDAADSSGERLWRLPLWDEHREQMKGTHSDIVNSSASRGAHPIQGAAFLSYFAVPDGDAARIGQIPWAHIDIAGVADTDSDNGLIVKGPTGFGVRLLIDTLEKN